MFTPEFDQAKSEAFGNRLVAMLNEACIGLLIAVGNRTLLWPVSNRASIMRSGDWRQPA